jgi:hypothetical protein
MIFGRTFGLALLLLAGSAIPAHAQSEALVAEVGTIGFGQGVRVDATPFGLLEGRFVSANDTTLFLRSGNEPIEVRLPDIDRLWVRGRSTRRGAILGAGAGVLLGVIGGLVIGSIACEPVDGGDCTKAEVAAVMGLFGGAGGTVVGVGIGFTIPTWRLRFP